MSHILDLFTIILLLSVSMLYQVKSYKFYIDILQNNGLYENRSCYYNFSHTSTNGTVRIRYPTDEEGRQGCQCLLHPKAGKEWPENGHVNVTYKDGNQSSILWDTINVDNVTTSDIYGVMIELRNNLAPNGLFYELRNLRNGRSLTMQPERVIYHTPANVQLDVSCDYNSWPMYTPTSNTTTTTTTSPTTTTSTTTTTTSPSTPSPLTETSESTQLENTTNAPGSNPNAQNIKDKENNSESRTLYIIIAGAVSGGLFLLLIVLIIVLLRIKGIRPCSKSEKKDSGLNFNSREPQNDYVSYVNTAPKTENSVTDDTITDENEDKIEYAQVDIAKLAPRKASTQSQNSRKIPQKTDDQLIYADLDHGQNKTKPKSVFTAKNPRPITHNDIDVSQLYAQPMKKSQSSKKLKAEEPAVYKAEEFPVYTKPKKKKVPTATLR